MSMTYIRDHYGVPAKRGGRILFDHGGSMQYATIVGSQGHSLRVRFDTGGGIWTLHPTRNITYLNEGGDGVSITPGAE